MAARKPSPPKPPKPPVRKAPARKAPAKRPSEAKPTSHPLKESMKRWDWDKVMDELRERSARLPGIPLGELLEDPVVDAKGKQHPMPSVDSFYYHIGTGAHAEEWGRIQEMRGLQMADETMRVSHKALQAESQVELGAYRLLVDTLKWNAEKRAERHYGNKQKVEHSGEVSTNWSEVFGEGPPKPRGDGT